MVEIMASLQSHYDVFNTIMNGNTVLEAQPWEQHLVSLVGAPLPSLRFCVGFLLSIAAGFIHARVPNGTAKHLWAIFSGIGLLLYPFGTGVFRIFVPAFIVYFAMILQRKRAGTVAWLIAFSVLVWTHWTQASGVKWKTGHVDNTGAAMVLVLKVISVAYNYQIGRLVEKADKSDRQSDRDKVSEEDRRYALRKVPSILAYMGYLVNCGNLLAGPTFEFNDYLDFSEGVGEFAPLQAPNAPSPLGAVAVKFVQALTCLFLHLLFDNYYPVTYLERPEFLRRAALSELPWRALVFLLCCQGARFKYYFAWIMGDAALTASGFGFSGFDPKNPKKATWERYVNARPLKVDLSQSGRDITRNWNAHTGRWLRRYVYDQLSWNPILKANRLLITQLVTGLWHGVFPGYWFFFLATYFFFEAATVTHKYYVCVQGTIWQYPMQALMILLTSLELNYSATSFVVLDFEPSWAILKSVYFYGHILMIGTMILGKVFPPPRKARQQPQSQGQNGNGTHKGVAAAAAAAGAGEGEGEVGKKDK